MDDSIKNKLLTFFSTYKLVHFEKNEVMVRGGDEPPGIFLLTEGVVRQYSLSSEGNDQTLTLFKPIAFFPMIWALGDKPNRFYFEAITPVTTYQAPREAVLQFLTDNPDVQLDLLKRVFSGMDGLLIRIEHLLNGTARQKLVTVLLILAYRFGTHKDEGTEVILNLTESDLASQAGISRETVSREMQKLKKEGLLDYTHQHLTIFELETLQKSLSLGTFAQYH